MKINKLILLFVTTLFLFSCSKDDEGTTIEPEVETPLTVKASFSYTVSATDPYVVIFENTTESSVQYQSLWDYGSGEGKGNAASLDEVRYNEVGDYTVKLYAVYNGVTHLL